MNNALLMRERHESNSNKKGSGELLRFCGQGEKDVYNCSVPFEFEGNSYIFGRVESRGEWASSYSCLFEKKSDGAWHRVKNFEALPLEDPFVVFVNGEWVVGGTHVMKEKGKVKTYWCYFYRGKSIFDLKYFTTGPEYMKDIRLVQLPEGKIGVFSRPRSEEITAKYGCESQVGFVVINSLDELDADVISGAEYIEGLFDKSEWGGFNQAFYLGGGLIGAIGHQSYNSTADKRDFAVYMNTAYVFDMINRKIVRKEVIGVRGDYPPAESKIPALADCAFTSGIVFLDDEKVELYSGLGDCFEGKIVISNPFGVAPKAESVSA